MKLADKLFNHPEKVDLFIGAELLQSGRLRLRGNYPMLQETVLGWIVAGRTPVVTQCDPLARFCYESQEGKKTCYVYHTIPAARTQVPQQELRVQFVEVPSISMAHNNTTDESHMDKVFHCSDVKTGTPTKWKTSQTTMSPSFTRDS